MALTSDPKAPSRPRSCLYCHRMRSSGDVVRNVLRSGRPWLEIDHEIDHAAALREAKSQSSLFVEHRFGSGWKSLCLHGITAFHTASSMTYGYANELAAPHTWTEIGRACPVTSAWV